MAAVWNHHTPLYHQWRHQITPPFALFMGFYQVCLKSNLLFSFALYSFIAWLVVGYFRVLWTDYKYALVYECHKHTSQGTCYPHSEHVTFLARPELPLPDAKEIDVDHLFNRICKTRMGMKLSLRKGF